MKEILTALMIWISANTTYNTDYPLPNVVFLPQEEMNKMYYKDNDHDPDSLHGMYDKENDVIILPDSWNRNDVWDKSVLVHEMIHYYQDQNGIKFNCTQEMEKDAWPIQKTWLKQEHGHEWNYDQLWYIMISACTDPFTF